jgi:sortase A
MVLDDAAAKMAGELILDAMAEAERMIVEATGGAGSATVTSLVPRIPPQVSDAPRRDFAARVLANARAHADQIIAAAGGVPEGRAVELDEIQDRLTLERAAGAAILEAIAKAKQVHARAVPVEQPAGPASLTHSRAELFVEEAPVRQAPRAEHALVVEDARAPVSSRRLRVARAASWVEMVGLIVMLFVAYQLWGTGFQESHAQAQMRATFLSSEDTQAAARSGSTGTTTTTPFIPAGITGTIAHEGSVVARIQIPKVHIDQFVVEGTKLSDLAKGPGHYTGTPLPGQQGNVAIAGHRETHGSPFERLDELKPGDQIFVTTKTGRYLYIMRSARVVSPKDVSVLRDFGDNRLTLTTCTPKYTSLNRLIIVAQPSAPAQLTAKRVASATVRPAAEAQLLDAAVADSGWHLHAFPAAMLWIGLAVVLGLTYRRVRGLLLGPSAMLVLVPVWAWVLLGLFEHLDKLLPSGV